MWCSMSLLEALWTISTALAEQRGSGLPLMLLFHQKVHLHSVLLNFQRRGVLTQYLFKFDVLFVCLFVCTLM